MKISIIIPIYNVAQYIERCLQSVLNQTYQNIEIILVDDAGIDNSMEIAERIINNDNSQRFIKIIKHESNQGLSAARNTGIDAAVGDYVYFLDSDDEIPLNCIELLAKPAIDSKPDFVIGDYEVIGSTLIYPPLRLESGMLTSNNHILISYLNNDWYIMAWNKLVNKEFLTDNQLYFKEGLIHEDNLWSFQLACKARSAYIIKDITYNYFIQGSSITQKPSVSNFESYLEIIDSMVNFVRKEGIKYNNEIYNFIETLKSFFFYKINNSDLSFKFKYNAYKRIRKSNYKKASIYLIYYKFNKKRIKIRLHSKLLIHYMLPINFGFLHYRKSTSRIYREN